MEHAGNEASKEPYVGAKRSEECLAVSRAESHEIASHEIADEIEKDYWGA